MRPDGMTPSQRQGAANTIWAEWRRKENGGRKRRKRVALQVYDVLHIHGTAILTFETWWKRWRRRASRDSAMRAWERWKVDLLREGVPHQRVWTDDDSRSYESPGFGGAVPFVVGIKLAPSAHTFVDRVLGPIHVDPSELEPDLL